MYFLTKCKNTNFSMLYLKIEKSLDFFGPESNILI